MKDQTTSVIGKKKPLNFCCWYLFDKKPERTGDWDGESDAEYPSVEREKEDGKIPERSKLVEA